MGYPIETFSDTILLRGTWCRCLLSDALGSKPLFEIVVDELSTSVTLNEFDLQRSLCFKTCDEILDLSRRIALLLQGIQMRITGIIVRKRHVILAVPNGLSRCFPPEIRVRELQRRGGSAPLLRQRQAMQLPGDAVLARAR